MGRSSTKTPIFNNFRILPSKLGLIQSPYLAIDAIVLGKNRVYNCYDVLENILASICESVLEREAQSMIDCQFMENDNLDILLNNDQYQKILDFSDHLPESSPNFRQECMLALFEMFQYTPVAFHMIDERGYFSQGVLLNISEEAHRIYQTKYSLTDFFAPVNIKNDVPAKRVYTIADFMTYEEYEKTPLFEALQMINCYHEATSLLYFQNRPVAALVVYHDQNHPGFSNRELAMLNYIARQVERCFALNLYRNNTKYEREQNATLKGMFNSFPDGVILCDDRGQIEFVNEVAKSILELYCDVPPDTKSIHRFIHQHIMSSWAFSNQNAISLKATPDVKAQIHTFVVTSENMRMRTHHTIQLSVQQNEMHDCWENYLYNGCLTPREQEIYNFVIQGFSTRAIADQLYISISTCKKHLNNIYKKLNVSGRINLLTTRRKYSQ